MSQQPFTPPPLPPELDYISLLPALTQAHEAVARYDEAVSRLLNPLIVRHAFETQEAVRSSSIEGIQATLTDVLELDAGRAHEELSREGKDYQEIANYRRAISRGQELLASRPLAEVVIKELHRTVLDSARGMHRSPGEFRRHQVHIGPPGVLIDDARYVPPAPVAIPSLFSGLVTYMQDDTQPDRLVQTALAHYQFEAIHPFADGNGRVGRIIIPLYLYEKGLTSYPNLYLSEFLEQHRQDYYRALNGVSRAQDWQTWIRFFLQAVLVQSTTAKHRVDSIDGLYKELHGQLPRFNTKYGAPFLGALFVTPIFTRASIAQQAQIPHKQTVATLIDRFVAAGQVRDLTPQRLRDKTYTFQPLLDIIDTA